MISVMMSPSPSRIGKQVFRISFFRVNHQKFAVRNRTAAAAIKNPLVLSAQTARAGTPSPSLPKST